MLCVTTATSYFVNLNKKQVYILPINNLVKHPQIYIKINNVLVHVKALKYIGVKISVISQKSLPDNCTLNKFPGKVFYLINSLNIIGSSQISIELKDNILTLI